MHILILGNGFDLAHGLPTKYKDFLKMCSLAQKVMRQAVDEQPNFDEVKNADSKTISEFYNSVGSDDFKKFSKAARSNFWISHFQNRKNEIGEDWINFEYEIEKVLKNIYEEYEQNDKDTLDVQKIKNGEILSFCKSRGLQKGSHTFRELYEHLMKEHNKLVDTLEIYMDGYVCKKSIENLSVVKNIQADYVLSFNYTDTYAEKYHAAKLEYCYIHGRADLRAGSKHNMVLGFDDHYTDDARIIPELIPFEKYYQRIVKKTDNQYLDWIEQMKDEPDNKVYIYGHSLGVADGDVLRSIMLVHNTKIYLFYYDEIDRAEKIKNLAIILGPNNLIRMTAGKEPIIDFINLK